MDSELTLIFWIPSICSDPNCILLIKKCLGKKLVAFQMLINFGVGDLGSNQIINVNPTSYFPRALILEIELRGAYFSPRRITYFPPMVWPSLCFTYDYRKFFHSCTCVCSAIRTPEGSQAPGFAHTYCTASSLDRILSRTRNVLQSADLV